MTHLPNAESWTAVQDAVSDAYFPHVLTPLSTGPVPRPSLEVADLGPCRIVTLAHGAPVSARCDHPEAFAVNVLTSGRLEGVIGGTETVCEAGQAVICPPGTPASVRGWDPSCRLIGFKVSQDFMRREMERTSARRTTSLPLQLDLSTPNGRGWLQLLRSVVDLTRGDGIHLLNDDRFAERLASTLTTGLLLAAVPDDAHGRCAVRPRIVRRVMNAMEEDPAQNWSSADLAEIAGVSVRRLQQAFREYVGKTPFQYLHDIRIDQARADLVNAAPPTKVTDIAMRWGITHTGRFAAQYAERYGETPSQTLKR